MADGLINTLPVSDYFLVIMHLIQLKGKPIEAAVRFLSSHFMGLLRSSSTFFYRDHDSSYSFKRDVNGLIALRYYVSALYSLFM